MLGTDLAKYILKNSRNRLSNLELQRYLYLVEIEYIKKFDKHLIDDNFIAWVYGPVIDDVYWKYRNYGANSINIPTKKINNLNNDEQDNIKATIKHCDSKTYWELVKMTTMENCAWYKTIKKDIQCIIDKNLIFDEAKNTTAIK